MAAEGPEELARAGLEHLQTAAREVIAATRSLLDAAEEVIDDPAAVQQVVHTLAGLAQVAARRLRSDEGSPSDEAGAASEDPAAGGVERIRLS